MGISLESATEFGINQGLESHRPVDPLAGSIYLATDTETLHICFDSGVWESQKIPVSNPLSVNENGNLLFNGRFMFAEIALSDVFTTNAGKVDSRTQIYTYDISQFPQNKPYLLDVRMKSTVATIEWYIDDKLISTTTRTGSDMHYLPRQRIDKPISSLTCLKIPTTSGAAYQTATICINPLPLLLVDEE